MSGTIRLTIATTDADHVRDFRLGLVRAEGIEPIWLTMNTHEIFERFTLRREWDVSEMSFAKFVAQASADDPDIIALPVYLSRQFRFASFYVNRRRGLKGPEDLAGKRIGVAEWAQTAAVYLRGWLQHEVGISLAAIDWVQAGLDTAGRAEKVDHHLPDGVRLTVVKDRTLSEMLAAGELDCVISAGVPRRFGTDPDIVRLFADPRRLDEDYFHRTKIFPIMHVVAMRRAVLHDYPWAARNLFLAFAEAKARSLARIARGTGYPVPWLSSYAADLRGRLGPDVYPYGIESSRPTLEAFLRYAHEQGVARRPMRPEDIFPPGVDTVVKV